MTFAYKGCALSRQTGEPVIVASTSEGLGMFSEHRVFDMIGDADHRAMVEMTKAIGMLHNHLENNVPLTPIDSPYDLVSPAQANDVRPAVRGQGPWLQTASVA